MRLSSVPTLQPSPLPALQPSPLPDAVARCSPLNLTASLPPHPRAAFRCYITPRESIQKSASARELLERMVAGPAQHHPVTPPPQASWKPKEFKVVDGPECPKPIIPKTFPVERLLFTPKEFEVIKSEAKKAEE